MTDMARGNIRISIENQYHDLYKKLSEGNDPEAAPFNTMKDLFMLAACIGYERGQRRPLQSGRRQIFHWAQFSEQVDVPILKAIAIASSNEIELLGDAEAIVQIAEEYANYGIQEIRRHIADDLGQPLWNLVNQIRV